MTGNLKISDPPPPLVNPKQSAQIQKPVGQPPVKIPPAAPISNRQVSGAGAMPSDQTNRAQELNATLTANPESPSSDQKNHNEAQPLLFQLPKPRVSPELNLNHRPHAFSPKPVSDSWQTQQHSRRDEEDSVLDASVLIDDLVAQAEASENSLESESIAITDSFRPTIRQLFTGFSQRTSQTFAWLRRSLDSAVHNTRVLRWSAVGLTALLLMIWAGSRLIGSDDGSVRLAEEDHRPPAIGQKASYDSNSAKKTSSLIATPKAIDENETTVSAEDSILEKAESASTTIPGGVVATIDGQANGRVDSAEIAGPESTANDESDANDGVINPTIDTQSSDRKRVPSHADKSTRSRRKKGRSSTATQSKVDKPSVAAKSSKSSFDAIKPNAKSLLAKARKSHGSKAFKLAQRSYEIKPSRASLVIMARAACEMKNIRKAKWAYNKLPFGKQRRSVRSTCRKLGVKVGL